MDMEFNLGVLSTKLQSLKFSPSLMIYTGI